MHYCSFQTVDPRIPTTPGRSTSEKSPTRQTSRAAGRGVSRRDKWQTGKWTQRGIYVGCEAGRQLDRDWTDGPKDRENMR